MIKDIKKNENAIHNLIIKIKHNKIIFNKFININ